MDAHRVASGAGKAFGAMGGEDVDVFRAVLAGLQAKGKLGQKGVGYDPYSATEIEEPVVAILQEGETVETVYPGDEVEVILPRTCFYVEAGGQVSDTGTIVSVSEPRWEIKVEDVRRPAAGVIVHIGTVVHGEPKVGDPAIAAVDTQRRHDIMRNHTGTHLLHAELHRILGEHARQAGSLVAPDRLRFDFTHSDPITPEQLEAIEAGVNAAILENYPLTIVQKPLQQAISEGAMALFGEKYGEVVRTITIGGEEPYSYELCGGTHVSETGDIGLFLITSEGSAAAGVRRIEAVTGRCAYELVQSRFRTLKQTAGLLSTSVDEVPDKTRQVLDELEQSRKQVAALRQEMTGTEFTRYLENVPLVAGVPVLTAILPNADADTLRQMTDRFRQRYPSGVVVLGSSPAGRPTLIAAVTEDLVKRGLHAGDLAKAAAQVIGGSGGGRPNLAQAGGKDAAKLSEALDMVPGLVAQKLKV
jgi:alanyl-tRNA synthetase